MASLGSGTMGSSGSSSSSSPPQLTSVGSSQPVLALIAGIVVVGSGICSSVSANRRKREGDEESGIVKENSQEYF